jgi:hypothetical protein
MGITQVDGSHEIIRPIHHADKAVNEIVDVTERSCMRAVAKEGDGLILQGLNDETADHPAITGMHPGSVSVEDSNDPNIHIVLAMIVKEKGLCASLSLIIAGPDADGIHVPPIGLILGMGGRIAVDFTCRGLEDPGFDSLCQSEHVNSSEDTGLDRLHRIKLIVNRRCRTGKIVYLIHFKKDRVDQVMADDFEALIPHEVKDISFLTRVIIVQTDDVGSFL